MESKRRSPRTVLNKILCIQIAPDNHAIVVDICDDGLGFHAVYPLTDSGLIHFSFQQPSGRRVEACGELVWTDPTKKSGGLRFVYLPQLRREPLRNWIAEAQTPASPKAPPPPTQAPAHSHSREYTHPPAPAPGPPLPAAHWPLHPPSQPSPRPNAAVALKNDAAATRPAKPSNPSPYQPRVAAALEPESGGPGFVLLGNHLPQDAAYLRDPQMSFSRPRRSFFPGFFTGVIFSAVVAGILLFAYSNPVRYLQTLVNVRRNATSAAQLAPTTPKTATSAPSQASPAPSAAPASQLPPLPDPSTASQQAAPSSRNSGSSKQLTDNMGGLSGNAGNQVEGARDASVAVAGGPRLVVPNSTHEPFARSDANTTVTQAARESSLPASPAPDPGRADLALAQRYLREGNGTADRIAAKFLWAAVGKGSVAAELTLADLYARGDGVQKDCGQARVLLQAASEIDTSQAFQDLAPAIRRACR